MTNPYNLESDFFTPTAQNGITTARSIISDENALILEELTPQINRFFHHRQLQQNLKINGTITCDNIIAKNLSTVDEATGNITTNLTVNNDLTFVQAQSAKLESLEVTGTINGNINGTALGITGNVSGSQVQGDISGNAATVTNGVYTTNSVTALNDVTSAGSGQIITDEERTALGNKLDASAVAEGQILACGISGNAAGITGNVSGSQVQGNISGNAAGITGTLSWGGNQETLQDILNAIHVFISNHSP